LSDQTNKNGQPIGRPLPDWTPRPHPPRTPIEGRFCRIEPFSIDAHAPDLFKAFQLNTSGANWTYLSYEPTETEADLRDIMAGGWLGDDPLFHTIVDQVTNKPVGVAALMRIDKANGVIEVGNIHYSEHLKQRPAATEAMFLLMRRVFKELGYRRYEWKCDSLNAPSRAAAARLGFQYDGLFPQAIVCKGRNRDTAWFSILDSDWPALEAGYEAWLSADNFTASGQQKRRLQDCTADHRS
jgi:RimJ/RimL family protein N-acetyltransferase